MINCTIKQLFPQQNVLGWLRHVYIFYCDLLLKGLQFKIYYLLQTVNQNIFKHIVYRWPQDQSLNCWLGAETICLFIWLFGYHRHHIEVFNGVRQYGESGSFTCSRSTLKSVCHRSCVTWRLVMLFTCCFIPPGITMVVQILQHGLWNHGIQQNVPIPSSNLQIPTSS